MKKMLGGFAAAAVLAALYFAASVAPTIAQNVSCYFDQGGATLHAGSGCTISVDSGGILNVVSGGKLEIAGSDVTSTVAGSGVAGIAAGYILARGETALGGSNPTAVTTGLTAIVACTLTIKKATAPGVGTSVVTYGTSSGTMNMYGWKVTSNADPTLIASTGTETIGWACLGT